MESVEKGKDALIATIKSDAQTEEERIIRDAENQAAEKGLYSEKKVEAMLNDVRQKAKEQAQIIEHKILADVDSEIKRSGLRQQNTVMQNILDMVEKKMYSMIDDPCYRNVLVNWIIEAAIGLDIDSAEVNASQKERALIDERLLSEAKQKIQNNSGKTVKLVLSGARPLESQGVVLTTVDGRMAFNNQVKTRLSRNQRKIRTIIYNTLFFDNQKV